MAAPTGPRPVFAHIGDVLDHRDIPGFRMIVRAVLPCEQHDQADVPHNQYGVRDPEGQPDWICGYDVKRAGQ